MSVLPPLVDDYEAPTRRPGELTEEEIRRMTGESDRENWLERLGSWLGAPGYAVRNILAAPAGDTGKRLWNAVENVADFVTGTMTLYPLTGINPFRMATDRSERPEFSELLEAYGAEAPEPGWGRVGVDIAGGLATDPLMLLQFGGTMFPKVLSRAAAAGRPASELVQMSRGALMASKAGRPVLEAAEKAALPALKQAAQARAAARLARVPAVLERRSAKVAGRLAAAEEAGAGFAEEGRALEALAEAQRASAGAVARAGRVRASIPQIEALSRGEFTGRVATRLERAASYQGVKSALAEAGGVPKLAARGSIAGDVDRLVTAVQGAAKKSMVPAYGARLAFTERVFGKGIPIGPMALMKEVSPPALLWKYLKAFHPEAAAKVGKVSKEMARAFSKYAQTNPIIARIARAASGTIKSRTAAMEQAAAQNLFKGFNEKEVSTLGKAMLFGGEPDAIIARLAAAGVPEPERFRGTILKYREGMAAMQKQRAEIGLPGDEGADYVQRQWSEALADAYDDLLEAGKGGDARKMFLGLKTMFDEARKADTFEDFEKVAQVWAKHLKIDLGGKGPVETNLAKLWVKRWRSHIRQYETWHAMNRIRQMEGEIAGGAKTADEVVEGGPDVSAGPEAPPPSGGPGTLPAPSPAAGPATEALPEQLPEILARDPALLERLNKALKSQGAEPLAPEEVASLIPRIEKAFGVSKSRSAMAKPERGIPSAFGQAQALGEPIPRPAPVLGKFPLTESEFGPLLEHATGMRQIIGARPGYADIMEAVAGSRDPGLRAALEPLLHGAAIEGYVGEEAAATPRRLFDLLEPPSGLESQVSRQPMGAAARRGVPAASSVHFPTPPGVVSEAAVPEDIPAMLERLTTAAKPPALIEELLTPPAGLRGFSTMGAALEARKADILARAGRGMATEEEAVAAILADIEGPRVAAAALEAKKLARDSELLGPAMGAGAREEAREQLKQLATGRLTPESAAAREAAPPPRSSTDPWRPEMLEEFADEPVAPSAQGVPVAAASREAQLLRALHVAGRVRKAGLSVKEAEEAALLGENLSTAVRPPVPKPAPPRRHEEITNLANRARAKALKAGATPEDAEAAARLAALSAEEFHPWPPTPTSGAAEPALARRVPAPNWRPQADQAYADAFDATIAAGKSEAEAKVAAQSAWEALRPAAPREATQAVSERDIALEALRASTAKTATDQALAVERQALEEATKPPGGGALEILGPRIATEWSPEEEIRRMTVEGDPMAIAREPVAVRAATAKRAAIDGLMNQAKRGKMPYQEARQIGLVAEFFHPEAFLASAEKRLHMKSAASREEFVRLGAEGISPAAMEKFGYAERLPKAQGFYKEAEHLLVVMRSGRSPDTVAHELYHSAYRNMLSSEERAVLAAEYDARLAAGGPRAVLHAENANELFARAGGRHVMQGVALAPGSALAIALRKIWSQLVAMFRRLRKQKFDFSPAFQRVIARVTPGLKRQIPRHMRSPMGYIDEPLPAVAGLKPKGVGPPGVRFVEEGAEGVDEALAQAAKVPAKPKTFAPEVVAGIKRALAAGKAPPDNPLFDEYLGTAHALLDEPPGVAKAMALVHKMGASEEAAEALARMGRHLENLAANSPQDDEVRAVFDAFSEGAGIKKFGPLVKKYDEAEEAARAAVETAERPAAAAPKGTSRATPGAAAEDVAWDDTPISDLPESAREGAAKVEGAIQWLKTHRGAGTKKGTKGAQYVAIKEAILDARGQIGSDAFPEGSEAAAAYDSLLEQGGAQTWGAKKLQQVETTWRRLKAALAGRGEEAVIERSEIIPTPEEQMARAMEEVAPAPGAPKVEMPSPEGPAALRQPKAKSPQAQAYRRAYDEAKAAGATEDDARRAGNLAANPPKVRGAGGGKGKPPKVKKGSSPEDPDKGKWGVFKFKFSDKDVQKEAERVLSVLKPRKGAQRFVAEIQSYLKPAWTVGTMGIPFPAYVVQNTIGAIVQSMFDPQIGLRTGLKATTALVGDSLFGKVAGWNSSEVGKFIGAATGKPAAISGLPNVGKYTAEEALEFIQKYGVFNDTFSDTELALAQAMASAEGGAEKLKYLLKGGGLPRAMANRVENYHRGASYLKLLREGVEPGEAAGRVADAFIDYNYAGAADRLIRDMFPFSKFLTGTVPKAVETILDRPYTILPLTKLESSGGEEGGMPPRWLSEGMSIRLGGDKEGNRLYAAGLGLPFEQLNRLGTGEGPARTIEKTVLGSLSPLVRTPMEYITDRSFYRGEPGSTGYRQFAGEMPREAEMLIGASPASRVVTTIRKFFDERKPVWARILNVASGIRVVSASDERELRKLLERFFRTEAAEGRLRTFTAFYQKGEVDPRLDALLKRWQATRKKRA